MIRNGYTMDGVVRGALLVMHSKCRSIYYAIKVFKEGGSRDVVLWNSMIFGMLSQLQLMTANDMQTGADSTSPTLMCLFYVLARWKVTVLFIVANQGSGGYTLSPLFFPVCFASDSVALTDLSCNLVLN
ncbi:hypothetical protein ACFX13_002461 [Malus domestica]